MIKKGDTLVEVTLAVGIFSMVAVAIVAVMSGGTSNTQTALETTLAREEIDIQAETLRFIQASAAAEGSNEGSFSKLWKKIADEAFDPNRSSGGDYIPDGVYHFSPTSCSSLYNSDDDESNDLLQRAFFIDLAKLQDNKEDAIVSYSDSNSRFRPTSTYPRVYDDENAESVAEGIFVIAVKDQATILSSSETSGIDGANRFYDFYIRTCWDSPGSDRPSTISTVIRLLGK